MVRELVHLLEVPRFTAEIWRVRFERLPGSDSLPVPAMGIGEVGPHEDFPAEQVVRIRVALAHDGWQLREATFRYQEWDDYGDEDVLEAMPIDAAGLIEAGYLLQRRAVDRRSTSA